jgi:hypothetical protein
MSRAEDDEVTQVAPPHLAPSARPAGAAEPTEDLPAPPHVAGHAAQLGHEAEASAEELPAPPHAAVRLIPAEPTSDIHDIRDLSGPTEVSPKSVRPPPVGPRIHEIPPGEETHELPAPPKPGGVAALPELPDPRDQSEPINLAFESGAEDGGPEPSDLTNVEAVPDEEVVDEPTEPTDVGAEPHEQRALPVAAYLAVHAARSSASVAMEPVPVLPPEPPASGPELPDLPDLPDLPELPELPEPPTPPPVLERPSSGAMPAASNQAARETERISRFRGMGSRSLADTGMRQEEITRGHAFIKLLVVIIGVSGCMMFLIDGDPVAEAITAMGQVYTLGSFAWFLYRVRDVGSYRVSSLVFLIASTMLAAYTTVYLWGVSSHTPVIFALAIAFVAHSVNRSIALAGYLTCALAQLTLTVLLATGLLRDRSLIPFSSLGLFELLASQFVVHSMYFSAFLVARYNRRMAQHALSQLERAAVEVARRDMLLQEARQELSNALRVGAAGRYTGQVMGQFRLGMLLGHGAVGEVYEAADLDTAGVAAIKLLHGHATTDERQVQRFLREAEHASRLRSPHVVRVFDYGRSPDGSHYLAMERLRGSNLAEHLRVYERMPLADVVTLVEHVGAGLQAAWEAGIVHRDIKPQNIFRSQEPHGPAIWKILDFGVSKMAHQNNTLTQGNIIGTPSYMAPEQVEGQQLDHRADVFALAAVAYRALTGRPAFGGDKLPVVLYRVVYGMPEAPSSMVAVPADVDLVFARGLAKRREDRYATAAELARSLALASRGQLTDAMRSQARSLVRKHPWGTLLRPQEHRSARSA